MASPGINTPLHTTLFPPTLPRLQYALLLSSCTDLLLARLAPPAPALDQDLGLLQAVDERLACYARVANSGTRFMVVVDMYARTLPPDATALPPRATGALVGLRDADLKPAFRALHTAYVRLLQNPFYDPDAAGARARGTSRAFEAEVRRVGETWAVGMAVV
ncbi:MAG: hypothetical protein M1829_003738 [Trizodia sp. TS-e1964]|nr:MAG: hypothetical protein M1829_003738 [Trizodia sp. TS-e1964]